MNHTIPRTELAPGFSISRVLTGLWQIADMERDGRTFDKEAAAAAMKAYVEAGFTTFDMADHYGSAEEVAGLFKRTHPDSVQLLTKWVPPPGKVTKDEVRAAVERSLERLQTEQLDLLQFHTWTYSHPSWLDCLFWLQELKEEGLIRALGTTNFDAAHLRVAITSGIDLVTNQVSYSLIDGRAAGDLTRLCLEKNVKLLAYGTVAGGFLSERWLNKPEPDWERLETWSQMKYGRFIQTGGGWERFQNLLRTLETVAKKHSVSIANVASRYILENPAVGGVIIGARLGQSEHISDNQRLNSFSLDADSRAAIAEAQAQLQPIPGDCGDEYRKPPFLTASGDLSHHLETFPAPFEVQTVNGRSRALSGTPWESLAGYCRAVRHGNRILVSGTTATHYSRVIGGDDASAQTHAIIDKIQGSLESLGGKLEDVVRTRIYIRNMSDWEGVSRAHGSRFGSIMPANTLVQANLIGDEYLVEIEAEAIVDL